MLIEKPGEATTAVLAEMHLTEREFQHAVGYVAALGQKTTPSHNEVMFVAAIGIIG